MDYFCDSTDTMVIRCCYLVYIGWIHTYITNFSSYYINNQVNPGKKGDLNNLFLNEKNYQQENNYKGSKEPFLY